jgi:GTPase SAR1 family protein
MNFDVAVLAKIWIFPRFVDIYSFEINLLTPRQLVIVGKQSAGKSSLLKSLTDIPFPVDSNLCTQFAMRIVSRRTAPGTSDIVQASIEPGDVNPFTVHGDDSRAKAFSKVLSTLDYEAFEELIVEVCQFLD